MIIKYKLKHIKTDEVVTDIKGYLVDAKSHLEKVILFDDTILDIKYYKVIDYLEDLDGYSIFYGDKAVVEIGDYVLLEEDDIGYLEGEFEEKLVKTVYKGCFIEAYEEGLYFFEVADTKEMISYIASKVKILEYIG